MGTIDVYWNTNVYEKYNKNYNIVLWAIITDKIGRALCPINTSLGIRFYEKNKIRSIKSGITYDMSEVVMEIPYDLFIIFDDLEQYDLNNATIASTVAQLAAGSDEIISR